MRFPQAKRARSAVWTGVFVSAMLLVGVYVLFDILDVDGSQMTGWPAGVILVGMLPPVEAERLFHPDLSAPGAIESIRPSRARLSSAEIDKRSTATTILRIRQRSWLPRLNIRHEVACTNSSPADPA